MNARTAGLAAALAWAALGGARAETASCEAALVLALDVSSSVDSSEHALQIGGIASALRDEAVMDAILSGPGAGVMAAAFVWSGAQHQEMIADWTWLGDAAAIHAFAARIEGSVRRYDHWPTAVGRAAAFAAQLHARNTVSCRRRIIDISGDGANNDGVGPDWYRARGAFDGLTINGLVVRGADPDPVAYYETHVIHGPGAFVEAAATYADYAEAMLRKLLRELQPPYARLDPAPGGAPSESAASVLYSERSGRPGLWR